MRRDSDYAEVAARFARETTRHEMQVLHSDGLYRHLRFAAPGGYFPFDATPDMFDLFRRTARPGEINPGYWSEKVRAGRDEVEGYDPALRSLEGGDAAW